MLFVTNKVKKIRLVVSNLKNTNVTKKGNPDKN